MLATPALYGKNGLRCLSCCRAALWLWRPLEALIAKNDAYNLQSFPVLPWFFLPICWQFFFELCKGVDHDPLIHWHLSHLISTPKKSQRFGASAAGVESKECHEHLAKLGGIEVLVNQLDSWSGDLKVADPAASEWCISWIYAIRPKFLEDFFLFLGKKSKDWGLRVLFPISSLIVIYL